MVWKNWPYFDQNFIPKSSATISNTFLYSVFCLASTTNANKLTSKIILSIFVSINYFVKIHEKLLKLDAYVHTLRGKIYEIYLFNMHN